MSDLPPEYLDPNTPPDVIVTDRAGPLIDDLTLGEPLAERSSDLPEVPLSPVHHLVSAGDSLTHGMSSGAVFHTGLSWPALVATRLGTGPFSVPVYGGPLDGLPLNLEALVRRLERKFGNNINPFELLELPLALHHLADSNEDYWERGAGSEPPRVDIRYENVGIYGWDLRDALSYTAGRAVAKVAGHSPHDDLFGARPENDNDIAARSVLAPFGLTATQLDAVAAHGSDGGIDTLVVMLGANNALRTVVDKQVSWTDIGFGDLDGKGSYNMWRPVHFAAEYHELVRALLPIAVKRVILATVPHVTVAPIAKGVNPLAPGEKWRRGSRFFPYYTDPWIKESEFRPSKHRHLTHQQARAIDSAIDQYNDVISDVVRQARREGRNWQVLDLCGILDGLAMRRYIADPDAADRNDWRPYPLPEPISDLDTRFFLSDRNGRRQGGLFGLDAVHPTTSGYGIIAQAVLEILAADGVASTPIDFAALRNSDTLNSQPPALVTTVLDLITPFMNRFLSRT